MEIRRSLFSQPSQCLQKKSVNIEEKSGSFSYFRSLSLNNGSGEWGVNAHWDEGV